MKRKLLVNMFVYGMAWLLLAGLNLLAGRFLGGSLDWWLFSEILLFGALADCISGWLKSRQQNEKQLQEGAAGGVPTKRE